MSQPRESGTSESLWHATAKPAERGPLTQATAADVCVIGAGIAGLSVAYELVIRGQSVVLLDDGPIGGGETHRTTAHLASAIDDRFVEMERIHGAEALALIAQSHSRAIDRIETICAQEEIACDFERLDGYLVPGAAGEEEMLRRECALAVAAGLEAEIVEALAIGPARFPLALRFGRQGTFHPMRYLEGLRGAIEENGGRICCSTRAESMQENDASVVVTTDQGTSVTASYCVVATNTPVNDRVVVHTKQAPYRTFAVAFQAPIDAFPPVLLWDTLDPYHYVRRWRDRDHDVVIVGGEDHKTGQSNDGPARIARLEQWAREQFPFLQDRLFAWSGQVMETVDGLGFIGLNPGDHRIYIATGDSGMGMTHGTIAGMLLADLITGKETPWTELYSVKRRRVGALKTFVEENVNAALQYTDLVTGGTAELEEIAPGCGATVREGMHLHAVYRDTSGALHRLSPYCPHLKGVLHWNDFEKTWDCPLHGSRFDAAGCVLNGPANADLKPLPEE